MSEIERKKERKSEIHMENYIEHVFEGIQDNTITSNQQKI